MRRVYLDYNSTTPLDSAVLEVIHETLRDVWGNPSSSHETGKKAKHVVDFARLEVSRMIKADAEDIIFASGGTEINNWIIHSAIEYYHRSQAEKNDKLSRANDHHIHGIPHVVTSNIEHDSISVPLEHLAQKGEIDVTYVSVNKRTQCLEVEDVVSAVRPMTCLVTIMYANNETGIIQPVEKIFKAIKEINQMRKSSWRILTHTDAAQAIGKIPVDITDLNVDYLTMAGHKFYGPRIGALYCNKPGKEAPLFPFIHGGQQERTFRSGTENVGMIAGLGKASQLVADNVDRYRRHLREMCDYLISKLKSTFSDHVAINNDLPGMNVLPNTCSVAFVGPGLEGYKLLEATRQLEASVGAACHSDGRVSTVLIASGIPKELAANTIRLSVGRDTTREDIDMAVGDLRQAVASLTKIHELGLKPEAEQTKALDYSLGLNNT